MGGYLEIVDAKWAIIHDCYKTSLRADFLDHAHFCMIQQLWILMGAVAKDPDLLCSHESSKQKYMTDT